MKQEYCLYLSDLNFVLPPDLYIGGMHRLNIFRRSNRMDARQSTPTVIWNTNPRKKPQRRLQVLCHLKQ